MKICQYREVANLSRYSFRKFSNNVFHFYPAFSTSANAILICFGEYLQHTVTPHPMKFQNSSNLPFHWSLPDAPTWWPWHILHHSRCAWLRWPRNPMAIYHRKWSEATDWESGPKREEWSKTSTFFVNAPKTYDGREAKSASCSFGEVLNVILTLFIEKFSVQTCCVYLSCNPQWIIERLVTSLEPASAK